MSDNIISQVYKLDSSDVDELNRKLLISNQLKQQLSADSGNINAGYTQDSRGAWHEPGTKRFASAATVASASMAQRADVINAALAPLSDPSKFASSRDINYATTVLGTPIDQMPPSPLAFSMDQAGQRQQISADRAGMAQLSRNQRAKELQSLGQYDMPDEPDAWDLHVGNLNQRATSFEERQRSSRDRLRINNINMTRDVEMLGRRGIDAWENGTPGAVSIAQDKATLYSREDIERLAKRDFSDRASSYRWDERKEQLGLKPTDSNWDVLVGERNVREDTRAEAAKNKQIRQEIQSDNRDRAVSGLFGSGVDPDSITDRELNLKKNRVADEKADLSGRIRSAKRTNTINDLGDEFAPSGGLGMDDEDIVQATGARAEARRNRASIRAGEKLAADIKVVNRGLGARGIGESEFLPDTATADEVYAAQQDIRGMGPVTKAPPGSPTMKDKWDAFQGSYGGRFTRGALYAVGSAGAEWANSMQNEAMTGRPDFRAQGNAIGSAVGGVAGAAIGSIFPGYGTFIGAGVGMQLGGTVGSFMEVSKQKEMMVALSAQPVSSLSNNYHGNWGGTEQLPDSTVGYGNGQSVTTGGGFQPAVYAGSIRIAERSAWARDSIGMSLHIPGNDYDQAISTIEGMAGNYESAYLGLLDAGLDPEQAVAGTTGMTTRRVGTRKQKKFNPDGTPAGHWEDVEETVVNRQGGYGRTRSESSTQNYTEDLVQPGRGSRPSMSSIAQSAASSTWDATGVVRDTSGKTRTKGEYEFSSGGTSVVKRSKFVQDEEDVPVMEAVPTGQGELRYVWAAENAQKWFLTGADEIMKKVFNPMASALPKTGGNMVDMITQFGGRATAQFEQILTPYGEKPPIDVKQATEFGALLQSNDRAVQVAQLSVRGSGSQWLGAMESRMASMVDPNTGIELIPGAASSIEYAKSRQGAISAQSKTWQDYDQVNYNMGAMRLQNQEKRYEVNPYSPGNRMAMELTGLGQDRARIGTLRERESSLRSRGMLSESQEFDFESQIEGLETNRQERIGHLVEGVANRLPSLSAGRPSFGNRIDSREMTAMQFGLINFPYRGSGAMNDQQRQSQTHFLEQFLDPGEINSRSRTFGINNMGGKGSGRAVGASGGKDTDGDHPDYNAIEKYNDWESGYQRQKDGSLIDHAGHKVGTWGNGKGGPDTKTTFTPTGGVGAGPMNGGNIGSTTTSVSAPDVVQAIQILTNAILSSGISKTGLSGETKGVQNWIDRTTAQMGGRR